MFCDEGLELGDERRLPTERELCVHPLLEHREPQLLEPFARRLGERLVGEIGERRPAPELERVAKERRLGAPVATRTRRGGLGCQVLEAGKVEVVVTNREQVAGRPRLDRFRRAERAPELGDLPLHLRDRGDGRAPGVQLVREPLDRHDAVRAAAAGSPASPAAAARRA